MVNGEEHVRRAEIAVKDLKSEIGDLRAMLDNFEKKNRKISSQAKRPSKNESQQKGVPYLTASNLDVICGDKSAVCFIGVFRSPKAKEKLEVILSEVSQKTFVRLQNFAQSFGDSVSYSLLDAANHSTFLYSFDKFGYKSLDKLLVAYKPRKGKFSVFTGEITMEEAEEFVSSVLNGDVFFTKLRQKPVLK